MTIEQRRLCFAGPWRSTSRRFAPCARDAFGNVSQDTNPGFQPFGFKSGLYDPDTGLVHFGARWYDPATGRWISKDPILLAGGLNLYVFCGNDPVNLSDPSGLCEETWWDRFKNNYSDAMNDLYGDDLDWADTLGLWGGDWKLLPWKQVFLDIRPW